MDVADGEITVQVAQQWRESDCLRAGKRRSDNRNARSAGVGALEACEDHALHPAVLDRPRLLARTVRRKGLIRASAAYGAGRQEARLAVPLVGSFYADGGVAESRQDR